MGTIADKLQLLMSSINDIRAAIVEKGQSIPATAPLSSYGDKIRAIQTGADTSDATAAAGDILSGKTAYVNGQKVTGTIASKAASNLTASGATVTVPSGYYPSQVSKSVATATQATPSIDVSSAGLITASVTQGAGYVSAGTKNATKQLTTQSGQTVTPTTYEQTVVASGRYTTGAVKVAGDANLLAENIKSGASIFGVSGTAKTITPYEATFSVDDKADKAELIYLPADYEQRKTLMTATAYTGGSAACTVYGPACILQVYRKSGYIPIIGGIDNNRYMLLGTNGVQQDTYIYLVGIFEDTTFTISGRT